MAVRRQLWRLFQEPHISGVITVEQPPPAPPTPPPPPPDPSPAETPLRRRGLRPEDCAVFQCRGCRAVLADSLHLCAQEERRLGLLACLSQCRGGAGRAGPGRARFSRLSLLSSGVTGDVAWEDALLVGLEGALLGWCVARPPRLVRLLSVAIKRHLQ